MKMEYILDIAMLILTLSISALLITLTINIWLQM